MPPTTSLTRIPRALLLAALLVLALGATGPAAAATDCGRQVINDWYDNGRVDGTYPPHCYDDAIDALPRDVRDYSSAKEDIQRALQARLRGEQAPPARTDPSPDTPPLTIPVVEQPPGETLDGEPDGESGDEGEGTGARNPDDPGGAPEVAGSDVDTTASDSVPLPLLVLAGLALLLVAAGSAGYVVRRVQARRIQPPTV